MGFIDHLILLVDVGAIYSNKLSAFNKQDNSQVDGVFWPVLVLGSWPVERWIVSLELFSLCQDFWAIFDFTLQELMEDSGIALACEVEPAQSEPTACV